MKDRKERLSSKEQDDYQDFITAMDLALRYHQGQKRADGNHYIFHPITVMQECPTIKTKIVALLHDILEDTDCHINTIKACFPRDIWQAVELLTNDETKAYPEFIDSLKDNELARTVKIADLIHNLDTIDEIKDRDKKDRLIDRYVGALGVLQKEEMR